MGIIRRTKMNLDNTPHPLIEDHYHIRELIYRQEKRTADRAYHQEIEKRRDQEIKDIAGFKDIETLDFWCDKCKVDFIGRARKQMDSWAPIAYYKIKHMCGTWTLRRITDRFNDEYWFKSKKVAMDRGRMAIDALQPFESGYNMIYGKR